MIATALMGTATTSLAAMASYVFTTEVSDGKTYLSKFDGSSVTPTSQGITSGAGLQSLRNSSGGGLSLINEAGGIYVVNPGTAAGGVGDALFTAVPGNTQWNQSPIGRHGVPASGNPSGTGIYRGAITGGVASSPTMNAPFAPFVQGIGPGTVMGDFAHDIFTGASNGHAYIAAQNSDAYIDLGAFSIAPAKAVQGGNGAIIEKDTGGVWYIEPDGTQTQIPSLTALNDNTGGKIGPYAWFNADGSTWQYDTSTNTLVSQSGANMTAFSRVGNVGLVQFLSDVWVFDSSGAGVTYLNGGSQLTAARSFGDYALAVIGGQTRILRDNGLGIGDASKGFDNGLWSGAALDLSRSTGGYLGVINEVPEPSSLLLMVLGGMALLRQRRGHR